MKKLLLPLFVIALLGLNSCQDKKTDSASTVDTQVDSLQRIIVQKDNEINDMLGTLNEIQEGLRLISEAEERVTIIKDGENSNKAQQIRENIQFISEKMKRNRELISKLRQKLRESSLNGEQLKATIDGLVQQLDSKDRELQALRAELSMKDMQIADLDQKVTNLNSNVTELKEESSQKSQTISAQDKLLNTAWYVFGTKKELKDQHIIENDRVLQSNFNKSYFTKVDIRVDKEIKLYSKSAKLMTNHPASSYSLQQDANKQYVLRINNPESFWSTSKYLVVLVK